MAAYDFKTLSSLDFEELVHDLLTRRLGKELEAFKDGKDGGIDLRHISVEGKTIVQCKHFANSNITALVSKLKNSELPKIHALDPERYILVTSLPLSDHNKIKIKDTLEPFVKSCSDIIGANELNKWLRDYPEIERSHFKLWISSSAVLERVLHAAEYAQNQFEVERIRKKIPIFVQTPAYSRALNVLEKENYVIISGAPGIGKTTLAEALIFQYMSEGFEPVILKHGVGEGKKFYRKDKKLVFYFDDFLGQTYLGDYKEYFTEKKDSDVVDFIEMVQSAPHARFILTTREHILRTAEYKSERFRNAEIFRAKCLVEISSYAKIHKAKILFNHIYFSKMSWAHKEEILRDDFFLNIIKNRNYNPRMVEWLSNQTVSERVDPGNFQEYISTLLDNPFKVWQHAFEQQISSESQNVLLALYSLEGMSNTGELKEVWDSLNTVFSDKYRVSKRPDGYRDALKEIKDTFVDADAKNVRFSNPSVRDFINHLLFSNNDRVHDVLASAIRMGQIKTIFEVYENNGKTIDALLECIGEKDVLEAILRCIESPVEKRTKAPFGYYVHHIDLDEMAKVKFLFETNVKIRNDTINIAVEKLLDYIHEKKFEKICDEQFTQIFECIRLCRTDTWVKQKVPRRSHNQLENLFVSGMQSIWSSEILYIVTEPDWEDVLSEEEHEKFDEAIHWYTQSGIDDELDTREDESELEEFLHNLEKLGEFGIDVKATKDIVESRLSDKRSEEEGREEISPGRSPRVQEVSDSEVKMMFRGLKH